jgi:hypothetical protein
MNGTIFTFSIHMIKYILMVKVTSKTVRKKCALYFGAEGVYEITITKKSSTSKGRQGSRQRNCMKVSTIPELQL